MKKNLNIPKTFFGFLIASLAFWILINLSKIYTSKITYPISYINLPQHKTLLNTPPKELTILIKGTGFNLLSTNITNKPLLLNLKKIRNKEENNYYFLSKNIHSEVQNQLKKGIDLIEIQKDTIHLKIGTLSSKKIPLKSDINISFKLGFDLTKPITIKPDSVTISGNKTDLNKISYLNLEKINAENLSKSTELSSKIIIPKINNFKIDNETVKVIISIDKFTEGEIEIPVNVKNAPEGINIFPKKVKLIYKVSLKDFNKISPDLFNVECTYNKNSETSYLTPKIQSNSDLITLIRVVPDKIDFLIHK